MYTIHGEDLESVDNATYLGVKLKLHSSMGPTLQLYFQEIRVHQSIPAKEYRQHPEADQDRMLQNPTASNPRVRLYSLGPTHQSDADKLERTQHRYARFVCNDHSRESSVTAMLRTLDWDTLAERRGKSSATMISDVSHAARPCAVVDIPIEDHLTHLNTRTWGSGDKFQVPYTRTMSARHSFFPDVSHI